MQRLVQDRYSAMRWPGVERMTCWLQIQQPNYTVCQMFPAKFDAL